MIEFDVDMGYLLDYDELDKVVLRDENGEHEPMEFLPKDAATVGSGRVSVAKQMRTALESRRTCASCPEMDNPDSYISHLQSALKWHDEHVPRPTNPRNRCVVLMGQKPPEEVLFVHDEGGVTHYLPEDAGTCQIETTESWLPAERYHRCKYCGAFFAVLDASHDIPPRVCPNCGRRIKEEAE